MKKVSKKFQNLIREIRELFLEWRKIPLPIRLKKSSQNFIKSSFGKAFIFSFLFHTIILLLIFFNRDQFFNLSRPLHIISVNTQNEKKYIKLSLADKNYKQHLKNRPTEEPKLSKKTLQIAKQIVNNETTGLEKLPLNSRFLGEKNQLFEKQTIAKTVDTFKKAGVGSKDGQLINDNPSTIQKSKADISLVSSKAISENSSVNDHKKLVNKNKSDESKITTTEKSNLKNDFMKKDLQDLQKLSLSSLKVSENQDYLHELNQKLPKNIKKASSKQEKNIASSPATSAKDSLSDQSKNADEENLAALGITNGDKSSKGLSRNNDFIEDVPLGDMTNLNTTEFKFFGFYARIRERLEQFWGSSLKQKVDQLYRSGKKLAPGQNYVTALRITIDERGNIVQITITGPSGHKLLDDAAIESFNKAGPFPNPPREMVKKGPATLEWGFVVKS